MYSAIFISVWDKNIYRNVDNKELNLQTEVIVRRTIMNVALRNIGEKLMKISILGVLYFFIFISMIMFLVSMPLMFSKLFP